MVQYNLPLNDFHGEPLLPFERLGPFSLEEIRQIRFYPDYCSSGIWLTVYQPGFESLGDFLELNVEAMDLPFELDSDLLNQIQAMQLSFDAFADSGAGDEDEKLMYHGNFWNLCEKRIEARFKMLYPQYAYLVQDENERISSSTTS